MLLGGMHNDCYQPKGYETMIMEENEIVTFGSLLRRYRGRSIFRRTGRWLSQDRFADEISKKTGLYHTRNLVSNWENDKSSLHPQRDRPILLVIISILSENGGITTSQEADQLLEAGNYKTLSPQEKEQIFLQETIETQNESPQPAIKNHRKLMQSLQDGLLHGGAEEFQALFEKAQEGPSPAWPRKIVALINWLLDGWSIYRSVRVLGWIWAWVLSFWLIIPALRWPFSSQQDALSAVILYITGALLIPLLTGLLTDTRNDEFWQQQHLATSGMTRLYTYQGAAIGFHLGYITIFAVNLLIYYSGLRPGFWLELIEIVFPLALSYMSAWLVPYNLWRAYGRLNLADGGIFFVFVLFGPLWGIFFYSFYSFLLDPVSGLVIILSAVSLLACAMAWQHQHTGTTIIPVHWWIIFYGFMGILYEINAGKELYSVVSMAGLATALAILSAFERIRFTLRGMLGFFVAIGSLLLISLINIWMGRLLAGVILIIWWRWGRNFLTFPLSFWGILIVDAGISWISQYQVWSEIWASIVFGVSVLLFLLLELRFFQPKREIKLQKT
jgi:hypothetical protein